MNEAQQQQQLQQQYQHPLSTSTATAASVSGLSCLIFTFSAHCAWAASFITKSFRAAEWIALLQPGPNNGTMHNARAGRGAAARQLSSRRSSRPSRTLIGDPNLLAIYINQLQICSTVQMQCRCDECDCECEREVRGSQSSFQQQQQQQRAEAQATAVAAKGGKWGRHNSHVAKVNACRLRKTLGRRATGAVFGSGFLLHTTRVGHSRQGMSVVTHSGKSICKMKTIWYFKCNYDFRHTSLNNDCFLFWNKNVLLNFWNL